MQRDFSGYDFRRIKVVVCDDSAYVCKLLRDFLLGFGVGEVIDTSTVEAAIEAVVEHQPDLVITDWNMSPQNGLDLVQMIRWDERSPDRFMPIIMLTGYTELYRVQMARDAGVTMYLAKPVSAKALYRRLVAIVDDERHFIDNDGYFGPDRRTHQDQSYAGEERRSGV